MKRFFAPLVVACALLLPDMLLAVDVESPPAFVDYQGIVLDPAGNLLAPDAGSVPVPLNFAMEFRIWNNSTGGNVVYAEKQNVTVSAGKFSVQLGRGTAIAGLPGPNGTPNTSIADVFANKDRYIGVAVAVVAGNTPVEIVPRLQFLTSPFAYTADRARVADNVNQTTGTATLSTASVTNATITNGTITNATINGGTITGTGANITLLNGSNISSGTVADTRLSTNVALLNGAQTFSGLNKFTSNVNMIDTDIYFRNNDTNHRLGWYGSGKPFAGVAALEGPVLAGFSGGILGTTKTSQKIALQWNDSQVVTMPGNLFANTVSAVTSLNAVDAGLTGSLYFPNWQIFQSVYSPGRVQLNFKSNTFSTGVLLDTGVFVNPSDRSLKKDIVGMEAGEVLKRVRQLRTVSYRFKNTPETEPKSFGFIAQEVEPIFPENVMSIGGDKKGIAYTNFVPLTVAALQEVDRLGEERDRARVGEIKQLQEENARLEQRLRALEEKLLSE